MMKIQKVRFQYFSRIQNSFSWKKFHWCQLGETNQEETKEELWNTISAERLLISKYMTTNTENKLRLNKNNYWIN